MIKKESIFPPKIWQSLREEILREQSSRPRMDNNTMKNRSEGERVRARVVIDQIRAILKGIEIALADNDTPIGNEAGQAVTNTATALAVLLAKLDAYQRAEQDQRDMIPILQPGHHQALDPLNHMTCTCLAAYIDKENPYNCERCGKRLSDKAYKELTAYDKSLCSYCGHPKYSTTCQRSHP